MVDHVTCGHPVNSSFPVPQLCFSFLTRESYYRYVAPRFELDWKDAWKEKVKLCFVPHKEEEASERVSLGNLFCISELAK
jgi:hypothetical protein